MKKDLRSGEGNAEFRLDASSIALALDLFLEERNASLSGGHCRC